MKAKSYALKAELLQRISLARYRLNGINDEMSFKAKNPSSSKTLITDEPNKNTNRTGIS